ncbi:MAG: OmpA family protein [Pseudomonadota bacterium]
MKRGTALCLAAALVTGDPARAEFVLQLPLGARETFSRAEPSLPTRIATGAFADGAMTWTETPGQVRRTVWTLGGEQTLDAVEGLILEQMAGRGYELIYQCRARACGGFDFRFGLEVVAPPAMRVDLRNYRYLAARQAVSAQPGFASFLMSRSPENLFLQMTEYSAQTPAAPSPLAEPTAATPAPVPAPEDDKNTSPVSIVLEGLAFASGSAQLTDDPGSVIKALAARLLEDEDLEVLLVGHSDMDGSLDGNLKLSQARAQAVRQRLIDDHSITASRVTAHGVGFLAPRTSNATPEGRQKNRRVVAVFLR